MGTFEAFLASGDMMYMSYLEDLGQLLDYGVRIHLYHGDADLICNWFSGEAASLAVNYSHSKEFAAAGYAPFLVDTQRHGLREYGAIRQYGNFSFMR